MGFRTAEDARLYAKAYRLRVKTGVIVPVPASEKRKRATINCDQCGKDFYRPVANRVDRGKAQYCSRECMAKAFEGRASPRKGSWESKPCSQCGKTLTRPAWAWKQTDKPFCDSKCFGKWKAVNWRGDKNPCWRGGKEYNYGPNWTRQARRARFRDGKACQFCHDPSIQKRNLDVHHIRPFKFFGLTNYKQANMLSNLITLCPACHHSLEKLCGSGKVEDWPTLLDLAKRSPKGRRVTVLQRLARAAETPVCKPLQGC